MRRLHSAALACALACTLLPLQSQAVEVTAGESYRFIASDFTQEPNQLYGLFITNVPDPSQGIIKLGDRRICPGDALTAQQIDRLWFCPSPSSEDSAAQIAYFPVFAQRVGSQTVLTLSVRGKQDLPPAAEDSRIETYRDLPNSGSLRVHDPEGQPLTFTLVHHPKRGTVEFKEDGTFVYTPDHGKVGQDSFVYTAADPAGNRSAEATVSVRILKPTPAPAYVDTAGLPCRFAAEWLKHSGIFCGENVGGQPCFQPNEPVSQGQFLTMLMQTLDLPVDRGSDLSIPEDTPVWLRPYLYAARRSGLIRESTAAFSPEQPISRSEAARMAALALKIAVPTSAQTQPAPQISRPEEPLTRSDAARALYSLSIARQQTRLRSFFG